MTSFPVVIHHNADCGTSRNVIAIAEASGYQPIVVEYLKEGWTRPQLLALFAAAGLSAREALREKKSPAAELGLLREGVSEDEILAAARLTPRTALRESKSPAAELDLLETGVSDEAILNAMLAYPILVNRPIVATPLGVRLCRPSEVVLDLLASKPKGPVYKEDGELAWKGEG